MKNKLFIIFFIFLIVSDIFGYQKIEGPQTLMGTRIGYQNEYSFDTSFINPASLALFEKKLTLTAINSQYNYNFNYDFESPEKNIISIYQPFEFNGGIQLFIKSFDSKVGYSENIIGINYGHSFNNFSLGAGINYFFYDFEIWDEIQNTTIGIDEKEFLLDLGFIWKVYNNLYLSSSIKSLNSNEHINYDTGLTYKSDYGIFYINNYSYKTGLDDFENQPGIGYKKAFLNNLFIASAGFDFNKSFNAGFSINYKFLNFDLAYQNEFENNFYDKLSFGISLKFDYDWYAEKKDVFISRNETNLFHFIVITKNEIKIKDKWIDVQALDVTQDNNQFRKISIKSNIGSDNIENAYLYIKIPSKWIKEKNVSKNNLKMDIIINNQRRSLPIFFLYEDDTNYYYMAITDEL